MDITQQIERIINIMRSYMSTYKDKDYYLADDYIKNGYDIEEIEGYDEIFLYVQEHPELVTDKLLSTRKDFMKNFLNVMFDEEYAHDYIEKKLTNVIVKLANQNVDKYNNQMEEQRRKWKRNIRKLIHIREEADKDYVNITEIRDLFDELEIDGIEELEEILDRLLKDIKVYASNKNAAYVENQNRIKQEKLLRELKEKEEQELYGSKAEELEVKVVKEKLIDINNYELVEPIIIDNVEMLQHLLIKNSFEEVFAMDELKEMSTWPVVSMKENDYNTVISSIFASIDKETSEMRLNEYVYYLGAFIHKYEIYLFYKDVIRKSLDICNLSNITSDEMNEIMFVQKALTALNSYNITDDEKYSLLDEYNSKLDAIIASRKIKPTENDKMVIKGFVLFDYRKDESENLVPYIITDLDAGHKYTAIDASVPRDKLISKGYQDFNNLIDDITMLGEPRALLERTDKLSSYVRPVYKTTSAHDYVKTTSDNTTGMIRIRPTKTSLVRFIEERIPLNPTDKNYEAIKSLIESKFENVTLSDGGFNLYINYLTSFKLKDTDSYMACNKRFNISILGKLLHNEELSQEDLDELSKAIDASIEAYQKLSEINSSFKFKSINKMSLTGNTRK